METETSSEKSLGKVGCEIWKDVKGYEGIYQVSNMGRVKSLARSGNNRTLKDRIMRQYVGKTGYMQVRLSKENKTRLLKVHRIVAEAFIDNPWQKPQVNHIDGNKTNNLVDNLEWNTSSENIKHAYDCRLRKVKPVIQVNLDGRVLKEWRCIADASKTLKINDAHIWKCCNGTRKSAGGYKWKYLE